MARVAKVSRAKRSTRATKESNTVNAPSADTVEIRTVDSESPEAVASALVNESEAEASGGETAPDEPPRRRPGRPRGSKTRRRSTEPPPPSPEEIALALQRQAEQFAPLVHRLANLAVSRKWPEQPYTMQEALELTTAAIPVMQKYGEAAGAYLPEIVLASVVFAQVAVRLPFHDSEQLSLPEPVSNHAQHT